MGFLPELFEAHARSIASSKRTLGIFTKTVKKLTSDNANMRKIDKNFEKKEEIIKQKRLALKHQMQTNDSVISKINEFFN